MAGQGGRADAEHETGTLHLVAITSGGASVASSLVSYSGTGGNKVCTVG